MNIQNPLARIIRRLYASFYVIKSLWLLLLLLIPCISAALSTHFQKIVDSNTHMPGSRYDFANFEAPSVKADNIVFQADDGKGYQAIYRYQHRQLNLIVDNHTDIPDAERHFSQFQQASPSPTTQQVIFMGSDAGLRGIYIGQSPNHLKTIVNNANDKFSNFSDPALIGHDLAAFIGVNNKKQRAIYFKPLDRKAKALDTTDDKLKGFKLTYPAMPSFAEAVSDIGTFTVLSATDHPDNHLILFQDSFDKQKHAVVANHQTLVPGLKQQTFNKISSPHLAMPSYVTFIGHTDVKHQGVYLAKQNVLFKVADTNSKVPAAKKRHFTEFQHPQVLINHKNKQAIITFFAYTQNRSNTDKQAGIYIYSLGKLHRVIDTKMKLDNMALAKPDNRNNPLMISPLVFGAHAVSKTTTQQSSLNVVMRVRFVNGVQALYQANISLN